MSQARSLQSLMTWKVTSVSFPTPCNQLPGKDNEKSTRTLEYLISGFLSLLYSVILKYC